jgi:hypothetical protein
MKVHCILLCVIKIILSFISATLGPGKLEAFNKILLTRLFQADTLVLFNPSTRAITKFPVLLARKFRLLSIQRAFVPPFPVESLVDCQLTQAQPFHQTVGPDDHEVF